ncbi:MAG: hypothetical protein F6J90_20970 [Moorea sp. SIOASIH]|nr:hypothetical protein [Moorena sp. SIOASIH]
MLLWLIPIPDSRFPIPCSLFPVPCSLVKKKLQTQKICHKPHGEIVLYIEAKESKQSIPNRANAFPKAGNQPRWDVCLPMIWF